MLEEIDAIVIHPDVFLVIRQMSSIELVHGALLRFFQISCRIRFCRKYEKTYPFYSRLSIKIDRQLIATILSYYSQQQQW